MDDKGNLFIADTGNSVIRKVVPGGTISTVAGDYSLGSGYGGDGSAATSAQLCFPNSVTVDGTGNLFIADTGNHVIREVDRSGTISTFAGDHDRGPGYSGDGLAAGAARLDNPNGVATDLAGNVYVADSINNVIRRVSPPLYWDPSQTGEADTGGPGTWTQDVDVKSWYNPLLDMNVAWSDGCDAIFSGTGDAVTISGAVSPASVIINSDNYVFASGGSLTLSSMDLAINVAADQAEIDATITGNSTLVINGSGLLTLGSIAPSDSGTDLESGTLQILNGATLGTGSLVVNGGTLDLNGNSITVASLSGSGGTITNDDASSMSTLTVDQDISAAFYGQIEDGDGTIGLTMSGPGVLVLPNTNAFYGGATVTDGRLAVTNPAALPDGTSLTVGADALAIFGPNTATPPSAGGELQLPHGPNGMTSSSSDTTSTPPDQPPVVTTIQCIDQSLIDADSVDFSVAFSKPVTGVTAGNFAVSGVRGIVASVTGSGLQYTVTVSSISRSESGALGLSVVNAETIKDWYGTPLAESTIAEDQQYTVDRRLYWDGSAHNGSAGGWGTWSPGNAAWHVGSLNGPLQAWVDGSDAFFAGMPGTVEVTGLMAVASMTFLTDGYVLDGGTIDLAPPQLQAAGSSTIAVVSGTATVNCQIVGRAMTKTGGGTLEIGAENACSSVTVAAGVLRARTRSALPAAASLQLDGGVVDLGGRTPVVSSLILDSGSIVHGTLQVSTLIQLYGGSVLADLSGTAALQKLGTGAAVLAGHDTYQGGTSALDGTLVATQADALPGVVTGSGTVFIEPTLYWSGSGDWTTGTWQLANGTPTTWIDGSCVALAASSELTISGSVNVGTVTAAGSATIQGGTLALSTWGSTVAVLEGTATIDSTVVGGGLTKAGSGALVLDGALGLSGATIVAGGTLDLLSPLASPPLIAGGTAMGPGAVFGVDGTSLYDLDSATFALTQSLFVNGAIDRTDIIEILRSAVVEGAVSPTTLNALEALVIPLNEARLGMPDDVAVLARDVVHGNQANAFYQGEPLGNLADQTSDLARGTALTKLLDKWFYGTDVPATNWGSYCVTAGSLFGDNPDSALDVPSSVDMHQGGLGDCYFIAALGALADSSPAAIENMFIDNGVENGVHTWTVRFYFDTPQGYAADYVTVNSLLPGYSATNLQYARPGTNDSWWMPLVEKAYAQWNETGHEGRNGQNTYASLTGGWMDAVDEQVLGHTPTAYSPSGTHGAEQSVVAAIQDGAAVTAAIFTDGSALFSSLHLVSCHAYQVVSYDADPQSASYGTFQLANPWGFYEPQPLTWSELAEFCPSIIVAETTASVAAASQASSVSAQAVHAAALQAVSARRFVPDAAFLENLAWKLSAPATDDPREARFRALDMLLAEASCG